MLGQTLITPGPQPGAGRCGSLGQKAGSSPLASSQCQQGARSRADAGRNVATLSSLLPARRKQQHDRRLQVAWQEHLTSYDGDDVRRIESTAQSRPLVILPGFGNCKSDYIEPNGDPDSGMVTRLQARGYDVTVVDLERSDWIQVARNLFTRKFWSNELTTHPGYTWYLDKVHRAVEEAREASGSDQVDIIGHSAGGWLGRAYIADPKFNTRSAAANEEPNPAVASLLTLGSPHSPPPPGKGRDMTGGALSWLHANYPGAYFADRGVRYVCVAGRAVRGRRTAKRTSISRCAHDAYWQVVGEGHGVVGDAVVPCQAAMLPGATNLVLDGVFHSMANFKSLRKTMKAEGAGMAQGRPISRLRRRVWYGSDAVVDSWLATLSSDEEDSSYSSMEEEAPRLDEAWRQGVVLPAVHSPSLITPGGSSSRPLSMR